MTLNRIAAVALLGSFLSLPTLTYAQYETRHEAHERAEQEQTAKDHRKHTGAKIVGGSAVGGAVAGAVLGGPKGAVVGGALGAGGGAIVNKVRKDKAVHKQERRDLERDSR